MVKVKHLLARPSPDDGDRIYIDRLWADGAFTEFVKITDWPKELAPSYELWRFHGNAAEWENYCRLYRQELGAPEKKQLLQKLAQQAGQGTLTLVYGNGDAQHNNAQILKELLEEMVRNGAAK